MESIREVLTRLGQGDLIRQFPDDQALIQHLVLQTQQTRQAQDLANYGRQVVGNWPAVQQFLQQQAQQQAGGAGGGAAAPGKDEPWFKEFWQPPDWNPAWEKLILRDGSGNMVPAPGAPPDIIQRYTNYQQFRQQQVEKLMQNPFEFFQPAIVKLARQEAEKLSKETLSRHTDTQFANDFIAKNSDWLYAADPNTRQPLFDPVSRQPVLSEWGTRFRDHLTMLQQQGMTDVRAMQHWALQATQRDYLIAQQQAAGQPGAAQAAGAGSSAAGGTPSQPASPRQTANQQFLQTVPGAQHNPNVGPAGANGTTPANQVGLSLAERLRQKFSAAGVKDSDIV
jgi:hypothetical protein